MNTIANITKIVKNGQLYIKRTDVTKYIGDTIVKKKFDGPEDASIEITLGELWDLTNTDTKQGNPKMPVILYNKSFFENIPRGAVSDTVWERVQTLLKTVFADEDKNTDENMLDNDSNMVGISNADFLKGCDMIVAAIEENAATTNKLLAAILKALSATNKTSESKCKDAEVKTENKEELKKFSAKSKVITKKNSLNSDPEYMEWREHVMSQCRVSKSLVAQTLRLAYQKMNKCYGIVWEQERKEFVEHYGSQPDNTMQIAYYLEKKNPAHKNLLASCVYDVAHSYYTEEDEIEENIASEKESQSQITTVSASVSADVDDYQVSSINDISNKIVMLAKTKQLDDKVLLSRFYNRVKSDSQIRYNRLCKDYKRKYNIGRDEIVNVLDVLGLTQNSRRRTLILYSKFMADYGIKVGA